MRYPIKDKFWGWRMDPFEVFAHWDSWRTSPNLTLTMTLKRMNRDQTDDFIFNSTKVMRGNAT